MKPNATHYHYMLNSDELPVISGVRGVVKGLDENEMQRISAPFLVTQNN